MSKLTITLIERLKKEMMKNVGDIPNREKIAEASLDLALVVMIQCVIDQSPKSKDELGEEINETLSKLRDAGLQC